MPSYASSGGSDSSLPSGGGSDGSDGSGGLVPFGRFIRGPVEVSSLLSGVFVADSLASARRILVSLPFGGSVVLQSGVWLSGGWVRVLRKSDDSRYVIVREQEILALESELASVVDLRSRFKTEVDELVARLELEHLAVNALQEEIAGARTLLSRQAEEAARAQAGIDRALERVGEIRTALASLGVEVAALVGELEEGLAARERLAEEVARFEGELEQLRLREASLMTRHAGAHEDYLARRDELQSAHLAVERDRQERDKLCSTIERFASQRAQQQEQCERLRGRREELLGHVAECQTRLGDAIGVREGVRERREALERALDEAGTRIDADARVLAASSREIEGLGEEMSEWRIQLSGWRSDAENTAEHLAELDLAEDFVVGAEIEALDEAEIDAGVDRTRRRLERMGPVNLVAESEYQEERTRSEVLTAQVEDLEQSCASLRGTMSRMENEIERKYRATFTEINANLKVLFARMFSGGEAYLKEYEEEGGGRGRPSVGARAGVGGVGG
ncbi:MAG: hypothetical protein K8963_10190, partial [Proteobacteria bacterium]|nr:hypothetical protein [Pseudomonadota bacterium]